MHWIAFLKKLFILFEIQAQFLMILNNQLPY